MKQQQIKTICHRVSQETRYVIFNLWEVAQREREREGGGDRESEREID